LIVGRKVLTAVCIAVGVILFVSGFFASQVFFVIQKGQAGSEKLGISGHAVIKAYHADGTLYKIWEGHNSLTGWARDAIATCATNTSSMITCSPWITRIGIQGSTQFQVNPANNTLLPTGCNPNAFFSGQGGSPCTGWKVDATFIIPQGGGGSVNLIYGYPPTALSFDEINVSPALSVAAGDQLVVTITFTVP
jgi:hypothetical protein